MTLLRPTWSLHDLTDLIIDEVRRMIFPRVASLSANTHLADDIGLDDLHLIDLALALEDKLGVEIESEECLSGTVRLMAAHLLQMLAQQTPTHSHSGPVITPLTGPERRGGSVSSLRAAAPTSSQQEQSHG